MSSDGPCREGQASGFAPPVPSTRPAAHPMVHTGRCKHPTLHLRYHLPGQLNMALGAGTFHVAGNRASKLICTAVPGSAWDSQC
jgi:hypothetical protein